MVFVFLIVSAEYGAPNFVEASKGIINSPKTPPAVKSIFERYIKAVADSKPCVEKPNKPCIMNVYEKIGVPGMKEGIKKSQGPLKQLLEELLLIDQKAVEELRAARTGEEAVKICQRVLNEKAIAIKKYLAKIKK